MWNKPPRGSLPGPLAKPSTEIFTYPAITKAPIINPSDDKSSDNEVASSNSREGAASSTSNAAKGDK